MQDRLRRGEDPDYVEAVAARRSTRDALTLGFARRIATYKRLFLLIATTPSARSAAAPAPGPAVRRRRQGPPARREGQAASLSDLFRLKGAAERRGRVAFLEDYDLSVAAPSWWRGCDVWVNVPRPPHEASGTSGMKAASNGGLNLSVLDGWWAEAYDGENGWAIDGNAPEGEDEATQDARHADALYDLLEQHVIPLFYERDADGIPRRWLAMVRRSLLTNGPRFSASRMVEEYARRIYPAA